MSYRSFRRRRLCYWGVALALVSVAALLLWQTPLVASAYRFFHEIWHPPPDPVFVVHYLPDTSRGSPAEDPSVVREDLAGIIDWIVRYPGSELSVWQFGRNDASTTKAIAHWTIEPSKSPSRAARLAQERRERDRLRALVDGVRLTTTRHSPLAASITRILLESTPPGRPRVLLLSSDGLEESALLGDSECKPPRLDVWVRLLARHRLLLPDTFKDVRIAFSHFAPGPIDQQRCTNGPQEFLATRERWTSALHDAHPRFFTTGLTTSDLDLFAKGAE